MKDYYQLAWDEADQEQNDEDAAGPEIRYRHVTSTNVELTDKLQKALARGLPELTKFKRRGKTWGAYYKLKSGLLDNFLKDIDKLYSHYVQRSEAYEMYPCPVSRLYGFQRYPEPGPDFGSGFPPPKLVPGEDIGWIDYYYNVEDETGDVIDDARVRPIYTTNYPNALVDKAILIDPVASRPVIEPFDLSMFNNLHWGKGEWPDSYQEWELFRYPVYADMPGGTFSLQLIEGSSKVEIIPLRTLTRDVFRFITLMTPNLFWGDHVILKDVRGGDTLVHTYGEAFWQRYFDSFISGDDELICHDIHGSLAFTWLGEDVVKEIRSMPVDDGTLHDDFDPENPYYQGDYDLPVDRMREKAMAIFDSLRSKADTTSSSH